MKTPIEKIDNQNSGKNNSNITQLITKALSAKMALVAASVIAATGCTESTTKSTNNAEATATATASASASNSAPTVVSSAPSASSEKVNMNSGKSDVADSQDIKASCDSTFAKVANDGNSNLYLVYSDNGLKYLDLCSESQAKFVEPVKEDSKIGAFIKSPNKNDNGKCVLIVNPSSYSNTSTPFKKASEVFKNKKSVSVDGKNISTSDAWVITANATYDCPAPVSTPVAANTTTGSRPPKTVTPPVPGTKNNTNDYDKKIAGLERRVVVLENRPNAVAPHKHDAAYEMANSIAETQRRAAERQQAEELTRSQRR